jgi:hypothetical protein
MIVPVSHVRLGDRGIVYDDKIFRIVLFSRLREVEAPSDDDLVIDNDDFVMRDVVGRIDHNRHAFLFEEFLL